MSRSRWSNFHGVIACLLFGTAFAARGEESGGFLPLRKSGKPCNLDFEQGDLRDWTATGDAFAQQPIKGDTVAPRRSDMRSEHQGNYWIGTYEIAGDKPQGTLTSVPFKVTAPWAALRLAGGSKDTTRVELVRADNQKVFFKASGDNTEGLRPVVVDLSAVLNQEIFIRLIDQDSGGWGHINFDDFRLYPKRPSFAKEFDPAKVAKAELPPIDQLKFAGLAPDQAAREMTLPPGFHATLFAGEPDVRQPIAFAFDDRGRLWVAEAYTYPLRAPEGQGKDRILVFSDTDGDGKFDRRTVFMEGLNLVSGLEVGFGGVWVGAAPNLMFIPMKDGADPKPSGPPEILLDGWAYQDTHETLNTFTWGPDGWLYGCQGVFTHSSVGKPGTPENQRTHLNAGVWRYHPVRKEFELFAEGTSNPWGIDFDEHGQCIIEACVIPHLFHMIQGGRYTRQAGSHFNPYVYDDIKTIADHVHWVGNQGPHAGNSRSAAAGGGHAHAGLLVYQGTNWPAEYRGKTFMNNIHGACINSDTLELRGSGFVGHHAPNLIEFNDSWSQIINLQEGPDGAVYMIDWYDKNQCHHNDPNGHDRTNGRIFKIGCGEGGMKFANLADQSDIDLVYALLDKNNWQARHARRLLQERAARGQVDPAVAKTLRGLLSASGRATNGKLPAGALEPGSEVGKLRLLWGLHAVGGLKSDFSKLLSDRATPPFVRGWAIQFLNEEKKVDADGLKQMARLAREDMSPVVRLYLASAAQRMKTEDRWGIVAGLAARSEDANDPNMPLMAWYAAEPLAALDAEKALRIAGDSPLPNFLQFTVRRAVAVNNDKAMAAILKALDALKNDERRMQILNGLSIAYKGQRLAKMPAGWEAAEASLMQVGSPEVQAAAQLLSLTFGSKSAVANLKKTMMDPTADSAARRNACEALLNAKSPGLAPMLQQLLSDEALQGSVLRGLAAYEDDNTPPAILKIYPRLNLQHKRDALNTLASRPAFATPLLTAVKERSLPRQDLTADVARQLRNLKNADISRLLEEVWGRMRESGGDKQKEIAHYKQVYQAGGSQPGDASRGRGVYSRTCQQCHTLFDIGGKVGPDLTGSNRGDLDYLLQNIIDPNAVIPNDYRAWNLETTDDRTITGILKTQDDRSATLVTANETLVIPKAEIKALKVSELSMMPEGLLNNLPEQDIRDLLYYLRSPGQAVDGTTQDFFNGKDLSNWEGETNLWKVENGEIVGRSTTGLKHNVFLKSKAAYSDFRLILQIRLTPNKENSGVQFRSEPFGEYEMKGMQADAGAGWWGKLYEENGRALLWNKPGDPWVKPDDWNTYEIVAVGDQVLTAINGHRCVEVKDSAVARRGIFGLQMHAGGPLEVRFRDLRLELNPKCELISVSSKQAAN